MDPITLGLQLAASIPQEPPTAKELAAINRLREEGHA